MLFGDGGRIYRDLQNENPQNIPPMINGYRPDIYVSSLPPIFNIIGEAKTSWDLEREHSMEQLTAFLSYCNITKDTMLILAVPWDMVRLARAIIKNIKKKNNIQSVEATVLEMLPG